MTNPITAPINAPSAKKPISATREAYGVVASRLAALSRERVGHLNASH